MSEIGIVGEDAEALMVAARLNERGAKPLFFFKDFPRSNKVSLTESEILTGHLDGIPLNNIGALLIRNHNALALPQVVSMPSPKQWKKIRDRHQEYLHARLEIMSLVSSMIRLIRWNGITVNTLESLDYHWQKPYQLALLKENGIPVPEFVCGNDSKMFLAFMSQKGRREFVYKSLSGIGNAVLTTREYFEMHQRSLKFEPVLIQDLVKGKNLRIYILDGRVIAAGEIVHKRFDSGTDIRAIVPLEPPKAMKRAVLKAARLLDMTFTGVDVVYNEETGEFHILECNDPAGFAPFERLTNVPIARMLADFLVDNAS